jgi:hypothetical protein
MDTINTNELKAEVGVLVSEAPAYMQIETLDQANTVAGYLKRVRDCRKKIEDRIGPIRDNAHATWKGIIALITEIDARPKEIEGACRRMLAAWDEIEQRRVAEAQAKEDEKARQAAIAEKSADGDSRGAKAIKENKVAVVSTVVVAPPAKVKGVSYPVTYKAEVVDLVALVKACAAGRAPANYITANQQALDGVARSTKGTITIPGVVIRKITSTQARRECR